MNRWMRWGTAAKEDEEEVAVIKEEAQTDTAAVNTRLVHAGSGRGGIDGGVHVRSCDRSGTEWLLNASSAASLTR